MSFPSLTIREKWEAEYRGDCIYLHGPRGIVIIIRPSTRDFALTPSYVLHELINHGWLEPRFEARTLSQNEQRELPPKDEKR